jgi:uncharacterized protein
MSHTPHTLHDEFPEFKEAIHRLKMHNAHFAREAETFDALAHSIHRAETNIAPMDDFALEALKKQRLNLKDQLFAMLTDAAS